MSDLRTEAIEAMRDGAAERLGFAQKPRVAAANLDALLDFLTENIEESTVWRFSSEVPDPLVPERIHTIDLAVLREGNS